MSTEKYRKRKREWAKTNSQKEYRRNYMRKWREKNREAYNKWSREYHHKNKHKWESRTREYMLKCIYGITQEIYEDILELQEHRCLICGKFHEETSKGLHIDHDHNTNKIRGLLCSRCNGALGWYEKYKKEVKEYLDNN